jgi:mono/diheme cytochrome c family protein
LKLTLIGGFILAVLGPGFFFLSTQSDQAKSIIVLEPDNPSVVVLGEKVYLANCASCHGKVLEGQANWRKADNEGYMPAPPHNEEGHTWHHSDNYLFLITKYGIERIIGQKYPNNMPAYDSQLTDKEIVAVLSYIKSTWSERIQRAHDQINKQAKNG